jgi:hypothetical protein
MLRGDGGSGYIRVDWFTPTASTRGVTDVAVLGTTAYPGRNSVDIGGQPGSNHFSRRSKIRVIDCSDVAFPTASAWWTTS